MHRGQTRFIRPPVQPSRTPVAVALTALLALAYLPVAVCVLGAGEDAPNPPRGKVDTGEPAIAVHPSRWPSPVGRSLQRRDAWARACWEVLARMPEPQRRRQLVRVLGREPSRLELSCADDLLPIYAELEAREGSADAATRAMFAGRADRAELAREVLRAATLRSLEWPVPERARVTSAFGPRIHPLRGTVQSHNGVDLSVRIGTEVRAPAAGVVRASGEGAGNGRWVQLDHGSGITTLFLHNSVVLVERGARVEAGQTITLSGDTGFVTGPHLHYQLHADGAPVDPLSFREPDDGDPPAPSGVVTQSAEVRTFLPM
jgi:hypothetical protein